MKFAICNETFQDWPLERGFQFARQCGYRGIELAPFTLGNDAYAVDKRQRDEIKRMAADAQLEIIGLHWLLAKTEGYYLTSPEAAVRRRTGDYVAELARLCQAVGGHVLVLGSPQQRNLLPGVTHEEAMAYAADVIRQSAGVLAEQNVVLAVEPLGPAEGDFLRTAEGGIELIHMIDSPQVRLHLDVKAMSSESKPIPQIIHDSASYLQHFHANDPNKRGPGMGEVDFVPIFQALRHVGYEGWVSVEVFDYSPGPERLARESIQYMQRCLETLDSSPGTGLISDGTYGTDRIDER